MAPRRRAWADFNIDTAIASAGNLIVDLLANASASDTITVARLVIDLWGYLSPTSEAETSQVVFVSVGVASEEAFLLGAAALPDPQNADEAPARGWLYVMGLPVLQTLPSGATVAAMHRMDAHFDADVHGLRKVDRGRLFLRARNEPSLGAATTIQLTGRVRALCLT